MISGQRGQVSPLPRVRLPPPTPTRQPLGGGDMAAGIAGQAHVLGHGCLRLAGVLGLGKLAGSTPNPLVFYRGNIGPDQMRVLGDISSAT